MTDNQKMRVQIYANQFRAKYKDINPYNWGGDVWRDWYMTHPRSEPIPEHMLPTEAQMKTFDEMEDKYIAVQLANNREYTDLIAFGVSVIGKSTEKAVWDVIARARPCRCKEAQCSFFCNYYGMENCYGSKNDL